MKLLAGDLDDIRYWRGAICFERPPASNTTYWISISAGTLTEDKLGHDRVLYSRNITHLARPETEIICVRLADFAADDWNDRVPLNAGRYTAFITAIQYFFGMKKVRESYVKAFHFTLSKSETKRLCGRARGFQPPAKAALECLQTKAVSAPPETPALPPVNSAAVNGVGSFRRFLSKPNMTNLLAISLY